MISLFRSCAKYKLQTSIIFPIINIDLSKFHRVNEIFDCIFKIRAQQNFKAILDLQIYESSVKWGNLGHFDPTPTSIISLTNPMGSSGTL